jgi:hypothetical protein
MVSHFLPAQAAGWKALSSGDLVTAAVQAVFRSMLTRDRVFGESASRALKSFPQFAIVVVGIPQQRWQQYRERFASTERSAQFERVAGQLIHWP